MTDNQQISQELVTNLINSHFNQMMAMNPEGWRDLFAEDAIIYDPVGHPPSQVYQDYQKFFGMLSGFFEQISIKQEHLYICGEQAAVKWTMDVTAKNGRQATAEGISVFIINPQGKIQQISAYWDEIAMMSQLK